MSEIWKEFLIYSNFIQTSRNFKRQNDIMKAKPWKSTGEPTPTHDHAASRLVKMPCLRERYLWMAPCSWIVGKGRLTCTLVKRGGSSDICHLARFAYFSVWGVRRASWRSLTPASTLTTWASATVGWVWARSFRQSPTTSTDPASGLVTNSILFCWLFKIQDRGK